ncbi:phosphoribosylformylglycinamidine synthase subunit PurS [Kyrpidia tusciae]|uniref:Phosphoribosylformylglycinamidine synthase subunit PurS n=1 Tax=Kyrpidia tusciae (strain DSM 2912 / NBRC 15312 / T2) TaxID=562970 RepID=D5WVF9_KYRT2|nr:phosphoribosylformylglycinamidine synthase subunit PurS [Kyrpidia tusciae]ADG05569.1 phosphoribosylformylglycinamidine synthase, purS [Kyrpidia tusciae DSM 2912]
MFRARVYVTLKASVLDPQGGAVERALHALGYEEVRGVRIGKAIDVTLEAPDEKSARERVEAMCRELLANPVMETFQIEAVEAEG